MPEANGPSSEMPTATSKKIASAFVALRRGYLSAVFTIPKA